MKETIINIAGEFGFSISRRTDSGKIRSFIDRLQKIKNIPMQRVGGDGDGGYWIPCNLEGIHSCFSPGVAGCSAFEQGLAERGIDVFLADRSVKGPAIENPRFHFIQKHIGSYSDAEGGFISLEEWYDGCCASHPSSGDKILQMDIEGSEYEVIHSIPRRILKDFRILVIEFHHIHQLLNCNSFDFMEKAFRKILLEFDICRLENNFAAGKTRLGNQTFGRLLEVTFVRRDTKP